MKKTLFFLLIGMLTAAMLTACGGDDQNAADLYRGMSDDTAYQLIYEPLGQGECKVSVDLNPRYTQDFVVTIPETSPDGDAVVEFSCDSPLFSYWLPAEFYEEMRAHVLFYYQNDETNFHYQKFCSWWTKRSLKDVASEDMKQQLLERYPCTAVMDIYTFDPTADERDAQEVYRVICEAAPHLTQETFAAAADQTGYHGFFAITPHFKGIEISENIREIHVGSAFHEQLELPEYEGGRYLGNKENPYRALYYVTDRGLTSYTVHPDTRMILSGAFSSCKGLTEMRIPDGVFFIGQEAFAHCDSLTDVMIPSSLICVGQNAFEDCDDLTGVYIESVDAWCGIAFENAWANPMFVAENLYLNGEPVAELLISAQVTEIDPLAFAGCDALEGITVDADNTRYHSVGNCIIETATQTLVVGLSCSEIPADGNVTAIGDYAFAGSRFSLYSDKTIMIPDSVAIIGNFAFAHTEELNLHVPVSVTSIGREVFDESKGVYLTFGGTKEQWQDIEIAHQDGEGLGGFEVYCTDGCIPEPEGGAIPRPR